MNYTKIKGKFVVHGILGDIAAEQYEDSAHNLTNHDIGRIMGYGHEMMRIFDTKEEVEAYLQGLSDMQGNGGFCLTSKAHHEKIYGKIKL